MKKKRTKNEMVRATIDCLHELKTQIENDPFVQTSPIVETFNLNGAIVDQLKTLRIIAQTENAGKFWIGNNPDLNMVNAIKKLQQNYRSEYQNRKNASNFVRIIRNGFKFGKSKPKQIQSKINFFDDQTNDYTNGLLSLDSTLGHVCLWHNLAIAHVSKSAAECTTLTKNFLTSLFCYWHRVLHAEFNDER